MSKKIIAVAVSDVHLSHKPPACRNDRDRWYEIMTAALTEINEISNQNNCPVLCTGDIFHKAESCSKLVYLAMENMPYWFMVPGNHDLKHHRITGDNTVDCSYDLLLKCGYGLHPPLDVCDDHISRLRGISLTGFPYGVPIQSSTVVSEDDVRIAMVHTYAHKPGYGYIGATDAQLASTQFDRIEGYDAILVGDNHIPFTYTTPNGTIVMNIGTMLRRTVTDKHPMYCLVYSDGTAELVPFKYADRDDIADVATVDDAEIVDFGKFVESLTTEDDKSIYSKFAGSSVEDILKEHFYSSTLKNDDSLLREILSNTE